MALHQYNQSARKRIARAVQWTETQTTAPFVQRRRVTSYPLDRLVRAQQDIEHDAVGYVKPLEGPALGQSLSLISSESQFLAYNPGGRVTSGSNVIVSLLGLPGEDETNQTLWYIVTSENDSETALVRVASGGSDCSDTSPDANGVYPGKTVVVNLAASLAIDGSWVDGSDVWIVPVNHCPTAATLKTGERYVARKVGQYTSLGTTKPLYEVGQPSTTPGGVATSLFQEPRWWKTYGGSSGTEDTLTGGYVYYPSPHNREFRLSFNSNPLNNAGLIHNPSAYGSTTGNITITTGGVYVFTLILQLNAFATTAGWSSPPSPAESHTLQAIIGGSGGGTEIIGFESFNTDDPEDNLGMTNPTIGTMFKLRQTTLTATITRTFATTGVVDIRVRRTDEFNGVSTYYAQEFGVFVYNARLRIDRL